MAVQKISVAMCTYNGEEYIREQLESILSQTLLPNEIVISDDGSSDQTIRVINSVIEKYKLNPLFSSISLKIVINKSSLGVSRNFEQALKLCQYPLIALSDQDDKWQPDKLMKMKSVLLNTKGALLAFSDANLVDGEGKPLGVSSLEALGVQERELVGVQNKLAYRVLLKRNIVTGATALLCKDLLDIALPIPEGWIHDEWLALVASFYGPIAFQNERLIDYRQHSQNVIGLSKPGFRQRLGRIFYPGALRNKVLYDRAINMSSHNLCSRHDSPFPVWAEKKVAHEEARQKYPKSRLRRVRPIFAECKNGNYASVGYGLNDVVRDLFQPK